MTLWIMLKWQYCFKPEIFQRIRALDLLCLRWLQQLKQRIKRPLFCVSSLKIMSPLSSLQMNWLTKRLRFLPRSCSFGFMQSMTWEVSAMSWRWASNRISKKSRCAERLKLFNSFIRFLKLSLISMEELVTAIWAIYFRTLCKTCVIILSLAMTAFMS